MTDHILPHPLVIFYYVAQAALDNPLGSASRVPGYKVTSIQNLRRSSGQRHAWKPHLDLQYPLKQKMSIYESKHNLYKFGSSGPCHFHDCVGIVCLLIPLPLPEGSGGLDQRGN